MQTQPAQVKKATAGFIISLIAGILILINGLAWFALRSFVSSFMPIGVPGVGDVAAAAEATLALLGAIGVIFGIIVLVGAILIYMPGKEVVGGILVLIFSILSIVSFGGFIIGLILGIIGGALGIAKK